MILPERTDVVVVGAGVSGVMAALAARGAGRDVVLVGRAGGASPNWSGAVDVADDLVDATPGPLVPGLARGGRVHDNLERLAQQKARHPFARFAPSPTGLGASVDEALAALTTAAAPLDLVRRPDGHNHVLATVWGTVKRAGLVAASQHLDLADLTSHPAAVVGVVEWLDLAHFGADPVVEMLRFAVGLGASTPPFTIVPVRVPRVHAGDVFRDARSMARALDDDATRARFLAALRGAIAALSTSPTHLLTPAVLGTRPLAGEALAAVDAAVGRPVRELLSAPPSVPGERLQTALRAQATAAGVVVVDGVVGAPDLRGERLRGVTVHSGGPATAVACRALVLASGRFLGGGIVRDQVAREALFDAPITAEGRFVDDVAAADLLGERVGGDHVLFRAGVLTDERMRPLTRSRRPVADNVFAAGTVTAGHDPARDGSGLAVAAWTGRLAGLRASEEHQ